MRAHHKIRPAYLRAHNKRTLVALLGVPRRHLPETLAHLVPLLHGPLARRRDLIERHAPPRRARAPVVLLARGDQVGQHRGDDEVP